jgi:hypothetical protein
VYVADHNQVVKQNDACQNRRTVGQRNREEREKEMGKTRRGEGGQVIRQTTGQEKGKRGSLGLAREGGMAWGLVQCGLSEPRLAQKRPLAQPGGGQGQEQPRVSKNPRPSRPGQELCGAVALCFWYLTVTFASSDRSRFSWILHAGASYF